MKTVAQNVPPDPMPPSIRPNPQDPPAPTPIDPPVAPQFDPKLPSTPPGGGHTILDSEDHFEVELIPY